MKLSKTHTDEAVLAEIGKRIARRRIAHHLTQAELAEEAGIGKRTLERVEAGETTQFSTIIRVFRVLGLFPRLDQILDEPEIRPLEAVAGKRKKRLRAPRGRKGQQAEPWTWKDTE